MTSQSLTGEEGVSVSEELVERLKRWDAAPGLMVSELMERASTESDAADFRALVGHISSLQGEIDRLRKLLDNSSQSQPVLTPSGQPGSEPSGAWRTDFENAPLNQRVLLWCSDLLGEMAFDARVGRPIRQPIGIKFGAVRRYEGCDRSAHGEGMNGPWVFTHWMPLPEPPVASRAAESSPPSSEWASSRDEPETPNREPSAS